MKFWDKITSFLRTDIKPKIISLLIACFLWYYINIFSIKKTYISLPVEIINLPEDTIIDEKNNFAIRLEILSDEDISAHINKISAAIDLSNASMGPNTYSVELLNLPKGLTVNMFPSTIKLTLIPIIQKIVPIDLAINSQEAQRKILYKPQEITIIGPEDKIRRVDKISTRLIEDTKIRFSPEFQTNVSINLPDKIESIDTKKINVHIFYDYEISTNKVFLPTSIAGLNPEFSVTSLPSIPIYIISVDNNLEDILVQSEMVLNMENIISDGIHTVPLTIKTPDSVKLMNPPEEIVLEILKNKSDIGDIEPAS